MATYNSDPRAGESAFRSGAEDVSAYGTSGYGNRDYGTSGYGTSGYGTAGYDVPDYGASRYGSSDYETSGYGASGYGMSGYRTPGYGLGRTRPRRDRGDLTLPVLIGVGAVAALALSVRAARRGAGTRSGRAALVAELNDLLQLDHDAVHAYTLAMKQLQDPRLRGQVARYRGDHERHIRDLTALIHSFGSSPMRLPHVPTGFFKLGAQAFGSVGGDRAVLLAFKANEGQVRDKYMRHAERPHPAAVDAVLRSNAQDEMIHYDWVSRELERMGAGPDTVAGRAEQGFEKVHGATANAIEAGERAVMGAAEQVRGS